MAVFLIILEEFIIYSLRNITLNTVKYKWKKKYSTAQRLTSKRLRTILIEYLKESVDRFNYFLNYTTYYYYYYNFRLFYCFKFILVTDFIAIRSKAPKITLLKRPFYLLSQWFDFFVDQISFLR